MTKIIQFQPVSYQTNKCIPSLKQQYMHEKLEADTFGYSDVEIDDIQSEKTKKVARPENIRRVKANAWILYDSVLREKENVSALISVAEQRGFTDILNLKGNPVSFYSDNLGRSVMVEYDKDGKDERLTTFYPNDNRILKIENIVNGSKVVFFNYNNEHMEITTTTKNKFGKSTREVFCYENGEPISYSKYVKSIIREETLVEACEF